MASNIHLRYGKRLEISGHPRKSELEIIESMNDEDQCIKLCALTTQGFTPVYSVISMTPDQALELATALMHCIRHVVEKRASKAG